MTQTSADLIGGWRAECAILEQKISGLRNGRLGSSLTAKQREAAIRDQMEAIADFASLITALSRREMFPADVARAEPNVESFVRICNEVKRYPVTESALA
jgi:hypothetical protein